MNNIKAGMLSLLLVLPSCYAIGRNFWQRRYIANEQQNKDVKIKILLTEAIKDKLHELHQRGYSLTALATALTTLCVASSIDVEGFYNIDSEEFFFGSLVVGPAVTIALTTYNAVKDNQADVEEENDINTYFRGVVTNSIVGGISLGTIASCVLSYIICHETYNGKIIMLENIKTIFAESTAIITAAGIIGAICGGITRLGANCGLNFYHWMNKDTTDNISTNKVSLTRLLK